MAFPHLPFTFRQLFLTLYIVGMVSLTAGVVLMLSERLKVHALNEMTLNGRALVERLASDSRLPLLQGAADNIKTTLETLASYPNVTGVLVMADSGRVLAQKGVISVDHLNFKNISRPEKSGFAVFDDHLIVFAPVLSLVSETLVDSPYRDRSIGISDALHEKNTSVITVGHVLLNLSLAKLKADTAVTNQFILTIMVSGSLVVTVTLVWLLEFLTLPIKNLARAMSDPTTAETFRTVPVCGVREAQIIASAFNALISKTAATHRELETSRADLATRVEIAVQDLKRQHEELKEARRQAEEASQVKSEFIANMSHEIRTPMHGFLGFLDMLGETSLTKTQRSYWRLLKHSVNNLLVVINKILDFSKLEAGKMESQQVSFHLHQLLEKTVELFTVNAKNKGLDLTLSLHSQLPEWVMGDPQHLSQILTNLISNALKFTRKGSVRIAAGTLPGTIPHHFTLNLSVQDTGIGIPAAYKKRIFESFNQVDSSTTRDQGGTGLGLAICQHLVELLHGSIQLVQSKENVGSLFVVQLPLQFSHPLDQTHDTSQALSLDSNPIDQENGVPNPALVEDVLSGRNLPSPPSGGSTRVLVVDDNLPNRVLVKAVLQELQADTLLAESGQAALEACRWNRFDLIVMDLMMPGMSGLETTARIRDWKRNANSQVPIIGLTGTTSEQQSSRWRNAGINECYVKPLSPRDMREVFRKWGINRQW